MLADVGGDAGDVVLLLVGIEIANVSDERSQSIEMYDVQNDVRPAVQQDNVSRN